MVERKDANPPDNFPDEVSGETSSILHLLLYDTSSNAFDALIGGDSFKCRMTDRVIGRRSSAKLGCIG